MAYLPSSYPLPKLVKKTKAIGYSGGTRVASRYCMAAERCAGNNPVGNSAAVIVG